MKKFLLLLLVAVVCAIAVKAQSNLYVYMNDGDSEQTLALADIDKITFEGGNLVITPKQGVQIIVSLAAVKDVRFAPESTTGLMLMQTDVVAGPLVIVQGGIVKVPGWDSSRRAAVHVYSIGAQLLYSQADWNGADIDISSLPKGIYVIKIENQSTKIKK